MNILRSSKHFSTVLFNFDKRISTITLNSPKTRNSLGLEMVGKLSEAVSKIEEDKPRVVIMKAEGPVFSAGHNLKELQQKGNEKVFTESAQLIQRIKKSQSIFIAQVDGICAAGGFQLAMGLDLLYCSAASKFTTAGIKVGVFCSTPSVELVRTTTAKRAFEMVITGEMYDAQQAKEFGFVNEVAEEGKLDQLVQDKANLIADYSAEVLGFGKRAFYEQIDTSTLSSAYEIATKRMCQNIEFEDTKKGLKAFAEKRKPVFNKE